MINKIIYFTSHLVGKAKLHQTLLETVQLINQASSVTLGPRGRFVAIQTELSAPRITKDGVTVVKHIEFNDRLKSSIATLVKNAANNANKFSGDGTTTTTLLTYQILRIAHRYSLFEANQADFRKGFQIAKNLAIQFLDELSIRTSTQQDLFRVAMISTNGDQALSELISKALFNSEDVKVQRSNATNSYLEYVKGTKIVRGIPSELQINQIKKIVFNYPIVLVTTEKINSVKQISNVLEKAKTMKKQLLIFAPDISEGAASIIYYNYSKKILEACPIRIIGSRDFSNNLLKKLAELTDSYLFTDLSDIKMQNMDFQHFGKCIKVTIDEYETTLLTKSNKQKKNAIIHIGASSETEALELYDKTVDALNSVKSAQSEGILPGGGIAYLRTAQLLEETPKNANPDIQSGISCIRQALRQPIKHLMKLSELEFIEPTQGWQGYDFKSNKKVNMREQGIIDSARVVKNCIIDSVSLAGMLLSLQKAVIKDGKITRSSYEKEYKGKFTL